MTKNINDALTAWTNALGQEGIEASPSARERFEQATFQTSQKIPAVLYPKTTEEVVACVEIANTYKVPLYTISSGRNWGFGSSVPVEDGQVLLNLTRMNQILEFNDKLGYVVLEPGVTYKSLNEFLTSQSGPAFCIDATGSSNLSSIIGNTLERGHGQTPYCDHIANIGFMEVVTGSGEVISTGFAGFSNSKNAPVDRWGVGPSLEGLFSQSSFGVVTKMAVWLMPAPEFTEAVQFGVSANHFLSIFDGLQKLRIEGTLKTGPHWGNVFFSLAKIMQYPWDVTSGQTPLPLNTALEIARKKQISAWNGMVSLYGSRGEVENAKSKVLNVLKGKTEALFLVNDDTIDIIKDIEREWVRDLSVFYSHVTGGLGGTGIARCYWRKKTPPPTDINSIELDADRCGVICVPVCGPADSKDVSIITQLLETETIRHGFEPFVALFGTRKRTCHYHSFIIFDRDIAGEDTKAMECQAAVSRMAFELGYHPHRLPINQMHMMGRLNPQNQIILLQLKKLFDPNNILSRGRYLPPVEPGEP